MSATLRTSAARLASLARPGTRHHVFSGAGLCAAIALLHLGPATTAAQAQSALARLAGTREGLVRFTFALRPGVCGQGQNIWRTGTRSRDAAVLGSKASRDVEYDVECDAGPGRVVIEKEGGRVLDVRFYVGGRWRANSSATDLGALGARDAAAVLLGIVRDANGKAGERAIFPVTLVDSVDSYSELLRIARDDTRPSGTRKQAVFWLGQAAEGPATAGLAELVGDAVLDRDVREQAVFALSQRPADEGVPALIKVVRTNRDPELRKKALFWLGQSGDPRAVDLIEELLTKR